MKLERRLEVPETEVVPLVEDRKKDDITGKGLCTPRSFKNSFDSLKAVVEDYIGSLSRQECVIQLSFINKRRFWKDLRSYCQEILKNGLTMSNGWAIKFWSGYPLYPIPITDNVETDYLFKLNTTTEVGRYECTISHKQLHDMLNAQVKKFISKSTELKNQTLQNQAHGQSHSSNYPAGAARAGGSTHFPLNTFANPTQVSPNMSGLAVSPTDSTNHAVYLQAGQLGDIQPKIVTSVLSFRNELDRTQLSVLRNNDKQYMINMILECVQKLSNTTASNTLELDTADTRRKRKGSGGQAVEYINGDVNSASGKAIMTPHIRWTRAQDTILVGCIMECYLRLGSYDWDKIYSSFNAAYMKYAQINEIPRAYERSKTSIIRHFKSLKHRLQSMPPGTEYSSLDDYFNAWKKVHNKNMCLINVKDFFD